MSLLCLFSVLLVYYFRYYSGLAEDSFDKQYVPFGLICCASLSCVCEGMRVVLSVNQAIILSGGI